MPLLAAEDLVEALLRRMNRRLGLGAVGGTRAHIANGVRMDPLLLADIAKKRVGRGVPGGPLVEVADLLILGRFARGQQPVDGRDARLKARPPREMHALGRGNVDRQLGHSRLEPLAMTGLRLGHAPQDVRLARSHSRRDQLIDPAGLDLAAPRLQQPITHLGRSDVGEIRAHRFSE
jgi:hypothetical protein